VVRILVLQALQLNSSSVFEGPYPVSLVQMREAASVYYWVGILDRALRGLRRIFILLDANLLSHVTKCDRQQATVLAELLRTRLSTHVKDLDVCVKSGRAIY
jgi:hypothetical protein